MPKDRISISVTRSGCGIEERACKGKDVFYRWGTRRWGDPEDWNKQLLSA